MSRSAAERKGIELAHWAKWDGEAIFEAFAAALTDANYHTFAARMQELWAEQAESDAANTAQIVKQVKTQPIRSYTVNATATYHEAPPPRIFYDPLPEDES